MSNVCPVSRCRAVTRFAQSIDQSREPSNAALMVRRPGVAAKYVPAHTCRAPLGARLNDAGTMTVTGGWLGLALGVAGDADAAGVETALGSGVDAAGAEG